jgi:dienelactone hydrolase
MTPYLRSKANSRKTHNLRLLAVPVFIATTLFLLAGCSGKGAAPATQPAGSSADITEIARIYVDQLAKGEFEAATSKFDSQMKAAAPADTLKQLWEQLTGQLGAFQQQVETHTGQVQGYQAVYVTSQFEKGKIDIRVVFNSLGQISGMQFVPAGSSTVTPQAYIPPNYANPSAFHEVDVTVGSGEWALPGTLTVPNGAGPFPGVVLVHGSGPNDRDEALGSNKPFRDLAWGLATQGVAVLRYDKRTFAHKDLFTPELVAKMTVKEETTDDALLAAQLLRQTQGIDPKRVFVLGHSLGATVAPRIGQQDPNLAGMIIMAGLTRTLEDTILDQVTYIDSLSSKPTNQQKADLVALQTQVAKVKDPALSDSVPATQLPLSIPAAYWLDLRGFQPAEVAKTLNMPLLIMQGGRDYQVSPSKDFEVWKTALAEKSNVTFKFYPDLNHLFMTGLGTPSPQDYNFAGHVSQDVVNDIAGWVKNN